MKPQQESLSPVAAPRLVRLLDFVEAADASINGVPVINLGGYRESEIFIEWTGSGLSLKAGNTIIGFYPHNAEILRDFINSALAGEFGSQALRLDLA